MKRIGITGGIGTGKTTVLNQLATYPGVVIVKTDDLAKQIGSENPKKVYQIVGFPVNFENPADLKKLAHELFTNSETKKKYEEYIHPLVHNRIEMLIKSSHATTDLFIVESALIFETNTDEKYDEIIVVTADTDIRIERLTSKRNISKEEAVRRMSHQNDFPPVGKKYITINNSGDEDDLRAKVEYLYLKLMHAQPKQKAIYAGSFDPFTLGHEWVVKKALKTYDLEIVIGTNSTKLNKSLFTEQERLDMIVKTMPGIKVSVVDAELMIDYAMDNNITTMIRGIRNTIDFASEMIMYHTNKSMEPTVDTIFMIPEQEVINISSSAVKEIYSCKNWEKKVRNLVSPYVFEKLKEKKNK